MRISILNYEELKSLEMTIINRANGNNKSTYIERQNVRYENRVKRLERVIRKQGYDKHIPLYIGCLDGKKYILDGQGRRDAIIRINEKSLAESNTIQISEIPCIEYDLTSRLEMFNIIKTMNTNHSDWKSTDFVRAKAYLTESEENIKAWEKLTQIMDKFGVGDYIAKYILYSHVGSHKNELNEVKFNQYLEIDYKAYEILHNYAMKADETTINLIKNTNFYMVFNSLTKELIYHYKKEYTDMTSVCGAVSKQIELFAKTFCNEERYVAERNKVKYDKKNGKQYIWNYINLVSGSQSKWNVIKECATKVLTKSVKYSRGYNKRRIAV